MTSTLVSQLIVVLIVCAAVAYVVRGHRGEARRCFQPSERLAQLGDTILELRVAPSQVVDLLLCDAGNLAARTIAAWATAA